MSARCPRCSNGQLISDRDRYGPYESCLQCGYSRDLGGAGESLSPLPLVHYSRLDSPARGSGPRCERCNKLAPLDRTWWLGEHLFCSHLCRSRYAAQRQIRKAAT